MTARLCVADGGLTLPFKGSDVDDTELTFAPADPALHALLALFAAALNAELAEPWTKVCASLASDSVLSNSTTPVADTLHVAPTSAAIEGRDAFKQRKCGWPLLTLHRFGKEESEKWTIEETRSKQKWHLNWILGPITAVDWMKLAGVERVAAATIRRVSDLEAHPAHDSGGDQLAATSYTTPRVLGTLEVLSSEFGWGGDGSKLATVEIELESTDLVTELEGAAAPFESVQTTAAVGGPDLGLIPALIEADSNHPGIMHKDGR